MPDHLDLTELTLLADPETGVVPAELFAEATLPVRPWVDELIDTLGFDPRSAYVEQFWLGILGPSTTWLLRRVAATFDRRPEGFELPLAGTAQELGLGNKGGRHSPFMRALWRCCHYELARVVDGGLEVRRRLPPLNRRQVQRLPEALRQAHDAWQQAQLGAPAAEGARRRARTLALTLLELDPDTAAVEQRLVSCGVHPAVAREASGWAWERHASAGRAAAGAGVGAVGSGA